ncbi:MAG: ABC transporter permease subunit [Eubacteriales bacterium]|nr:ABC transporter permease subunit [Eubacteriales bacterium]
MNRRNVPLIFGIVILLLVLLVMLFPEMFASHSPYTIQHIRFLHDEGRLSVERAPFSPDDGFLLGSDHLGRDIYSYIIYGTRLTISLGVLIALGQFLIAVPMALYAGFGSRIAKSVIQQFNVIFSAIPALLIAIIILKLDYFVGLEKQKSIMSFILVLTAVSWARLGNLVMERVETILTQPFIKGEVAIGKKHFRIAIENVIPHLAPELIVLFFMEIARNLSTLMQLGIFSVFIGNLGLINDATSGVQINTDISFEPEWASMLSTSRTLITIAPWTVIYPALAFFISVLGFNLFGEGLRTLMQKKESRSVLAFRKIITLDFKYFCVNVDKRSKFKITLWIALFALIIGFFSFINYKDYSIGYASVRVDLPETTVIGTEEALFSAGFIADYMTRLGIVPLRNDSLLMPFDIGQSFLIEEQMMTLSMESGIHNLNQGTDYAFLTSGNISESGVVYDATKDDLFNISSFDRFADKFILIEQLYYSDSAIRHFIETITVNAGVKGIILVARANQVIQNHIVDADEDNAVIVVSQEVSQVLKENPDLVIAVHTTVKPLTSNGYNVVGIHRGTDPHIGDEAIVVGMNYNYLNQEGGEVLKFNLKLMERLCQMADQKRAIIFLFLDGTINENQHGIHYIAQDFPYSPQKIQVYIDLTSITHERFGEIEFSTAQAPPTRQFAWSLGRLFDSKLNQKGYPIQLLETNYIDGSYYFTKSESDNALFWNRGIPTVILGTVKTDNNIWDLETLGSIVLEVINKNNY